MNKLFWSESLRRYADYGLHTDSVKLGKKSKNDSSIIRFVRFKKNSAKVIILKQIFA